MNRQPVILLVEDNPAILEANRQALAHEGYRIETANSLAEARQALAATPPDAIVLDILLPDGSGLDFLREMREAGQSAPVLLLTSLIKKDERLEGLQAGGDDYITKPYDIDELRARVAAFLRRVRLDRESAPPAQTINRGLLTLDTLAGRAFLNGVDLRLTPKDFSLLRMLVQNEGKTLSKAALYEAVWKAPLAGDDTAIKTAVSRLRKKLEDSDFTIKSLRGQGYRFE